MKCELTARRLFQCGRFDDPLGRLANTDCWSGLLANEFSQEHRCKAWAILARLQNQYLDKLSRNDLFEKSLEIESRILTASENTEIINIMNEINTIVDELGIQEFPHISYKKSND